MIEKTHKIIDKKSPKSVKIEEKNRKIVDILGRAGVED